MPTIKEGIPGVYGRITPWVVDERTGLILPKQTKFNQIQLDYTTILCQLLGLGASKYKIGAMYLEFENVADPSDPVTVPAHETNEGIEYYDDLVLSSDRDFLRVPLRLTPTVSIETGYEDLLVTVEGNKLTFFVQSTGVEGVHGKTCSDSVNSKFFGAALVATPVFADRTQDLVFARTYFEAADQTVKEASKQVGVTWEIVFIT